MAQLTCPSCGAAQVGGSPLCSACVLPYTPRPAQPAGTGPADPTPGAGTGQAAPIVPPVATRSPGGNAGSVTPAGLVADPVAADPAGGGPAAGGGRAPGGTACPDPDCVSGGTLPATRCPACWRSAPGEAAPAGALAQPRLQFPWGNEEIPASGALSIGRESSPLAGRLTAYTNVGRRHAQLTYSGDRLVVVDLNSVNGTFVNDERVEPMRPHPLREGDRLRFAAGLTAVVHIGGQR